MYFSKILMITSAAQVLGQRATTTSTPRPPPASDNAPAAGGALSGCEAVEAEAAACAAAALTYALTALNADSCPAFSNDAGRPYRETASITTVEECQLATSYIGYSFTRFGERAWDGYPTGCYCIPSFGRFPNFRTCYFNTNDTGSRRANVRPLCAQAPADDNKDTSTKVDSEVLALPAAKHLRERGDVLALAGVSDANTMVGSKALEAEVAALAAENAVLKNENAVLKAAAAATE